MRRTLLFVIVGGVLVGSLLGAGWIVSGERITGSSIVPAETTDWTQDEAADSVEATDPDIRGLTATVENQTLKIENPNETPATVSVYEDGARLLTFGVPPTGERPRQLVEGSYTITAQINGTSVSINREDRAVIDIDSRDLHLDVTIDEQEVYIENPSKTDLIVMAVHDETGDTKPISVPAESTRNRTLEHDDYTLTGKATGSSVFLDGQEALPISIAQSTATPHVRIVNVTTPVDVGESLSVTAEISNDGAAESGEITLDIDDRDGLDSTAVALGHGETETVSLTYQTTEDDIGNREVTVRSQSDTAQVTVEVLESSNGTVGDVGGPSDSRGSDVGGPSDSRDSDGGSDGSVGGGAGAGGANDSDEDPVGDSGEEKGDDGADDDRADGQTDDEVDNEADDGAAEDESGENGKDGETGEDETDGEIDDSEADDETDDGEIDNETGDDRTDEVNYRTVDSCTVIAEPGTYELVDDVERKGETVDDEHDDACIRITASDVVLDGDDNTVIGASEVDYPPATIGILVSGTEETPAENVTIRNLRAEGWDPGIRIGNRGDRGEAHIENVVVSENNGKGIFITYAGSASIEAVEANRNGGTGITVSEGTIESMVDVTANENGDTGVDLSEGTIDSMVDVTANGNRRNGIDLTKVTDVTAEQITASENGGIGVYFSADVYNSEFSGVDASDNDKAGIWITAGSNRNAFRDSTVENNAGPGIAYVESEGNEFQDVTVRNNEGRQVDAERYGYFSASALRIGDTAEFAIDEEVVSLDDIDRDELEGLPEDTRPIGDGIEVDGIENSVDLKLEHDGNGETEGQIELWRYDGDEWTVKEIVDGDEADGSIESVLTEDGLYAPVLVVEDEDDGATTQTIDSCTVVTDSGTYELVDDIEPKGETVDDEHDDACIRITASDVLLDGNDNAVAGAGEEGTTGVLVASSEEIAIENVTVRDLRAESWNTGIQIGIEYDNPSDARLENVIANENRRNGIYVEDSNGVEIEGVEVHRNGGSGISAGEEGDLNSLVDVTANENDVAGVALDHTSDLVAEGITVSENGGHGLLLGWRVYTSEFTDVTATNNDGDGLHLDTDVNSNEFSGIISSGNTGHGIYLGIAGGNVFRDSIIEGNGDVGVRHVEDGSEYVNVTIRDNEDWQVETNRWAPFTASELEIGDTAEFVIDAEPVSLDYVDRNELAELPEDAQAVGDGVETEGIEDSVTVRLEYDGNDEAEGQIELWRYDGDEWSSEETVDDEADGSIESTLTEDGLYALVLVEEDKNAD